MNFRLAAQAIRPVALAGLLTAGVAARAGAQAPAPGTEPVRTVGKAGRASIYSADRRFMVSGMSSAENMILAGKLAELAGKVEEKTGMPLPMRRDQVLGVMVQSSSAPDAQVLKMQGWDDGLFYQRLVVPSPRRLDGEDLMESACWLMRVCSNTSMRASPMPRRWRVTPKPSMLLSPNTLPCPR